MKKPNFIYNNTSRKEARRYLRKRLTNAELYLWNKIRRKQLGFMFRRQYSIGPYITDFYCPEKRLVVELDGDQHKNSREYDLYRTNYFEVSDIKTVRFWNWEVEKDIDNVVKKIHNSLR